MLRNLYKQYNLGAVNWAPISLVMEIGEDNAMLLAYLEFSRQNSNILRIRDLEICNQLGFSEDKFKYLKNNICQIYISKNEYLNVWHNKQDVFQGKLYLCYYDEYYKLTCYQANENILDKVYAQCEKNYQHWQVSDKSFGLFNRKMKNIKYNLGPVNKAPLSVRQVLGDYEALLFSHFEFLTFQNKIKHNYAFEKTQQFFCEDLAISVNDFKILRDKICKVYKHECDYLEAFHSIWDHFDNKFYLCYTKFNPRKYKQTFYIRNNKLIDEFYKQIENNYQTQKQTNSESTDTLFETNAINNSVNDLNMDINIMEKSKDANINIIKESKDTIYTDQIKKYWITYIGKALVVDNRDLMTDLTRHFNNFSLDFIEGIIRYRAKEIKQARIPIKYLIDTLDDYEAYEIFR